MPRSSRREYPVAPPPMRPNRRSLPVVLMRARDRVMLPFRRLLSEYGMSEQKWRVLQALQEGGTMDMSALADAACLQAPSLTKLLQALEADGYVLRHTDPKDRRRHLVTLAQRGEWMVARNLDAAQRIHDSYRKRLGPERYEALMDLLEDLEAEDSDPRR